MSNGKCWLIGAGRMSRFYAEIFAAIGRDVHVIGRGVGRAKEFEAETGIAVMTGGLAAALEKYEAPEYAIVATGVESLEENARSLVSAGTQRILLEKPGGLLPSGIRRLGQEATRAGTDIRIGFNRRFFASTLKAREIIAEDGGVRHISFDFTEMGHVIATRTNKAPGVREHWVLANSSHVIDMAFFLGGRPAEISTFREEPLEWHPAGSVFSGAGRCEGGALFSYRSIWMSPGRWGVNIVTPKRQLLLRPIETLREFKDGKESDVVLEDELDCRFKPGLYRQVQAFFAHDDAILCSIDDQIDMLETYCRIAGYDSSE